MALLPVIIIIFLNTTHSLLYLNLKTRSPLRILLVYLAVPPLWPVVARLTSAFPDAGPVILLVFFAFGAWINRLLVTKESYGRVFFCLASVFVFSQIMRMPPLLVMIYWLDWPPMEAGTFSIYAYPAIFLLLLPILLRYVRPRFLLILDIVETQKWYFVGVLSLLLAATGRFTLNLFYELPDIPGMRLLVTIMPLCIAAYFVSLYLFLVGHRDKQLLRQQLAAAGRLEHVYDFYGQELEERENRLRTMRHDFRHLALHLGTLAEDGDYDSLKRDLAAVTKIGEDTFASVFSENRTVNAVVSYHFAVASRKGVRCTAKAFVPAELPMPKADVSLLLGNALENCVKAASPLGERGYIAFTAKPARDYMVFVFENNYEPGQYATGEKAGLASIRQLCERHNGRAEVSDCGGVFKVTAFLSMV